MSLWTRIFGGKAKSGEGQYRPGPYLIEGGQGETGWLSAKGGKLWNWWQSGYRLQSYGSGNAMVEACVSAYSQTVAMCPGDHWISLGNGGRERVTNSDLARVLKQPNDYQSMSDLLLNLTRRLYEKGEAFALKVPNGRFEVDELHWMRTGYPRIAEDGSIFYSLAGNEIVARRYDLSNPIPARDVLHIRLHTPRHPLRGESPILATMLDLALSGAALNQQVAFYLNQARPSFMLLTDQKLTTKEADDLRARWDAQTQGENAGGTPILSWGLKPEAVSKSANDGQLADMLKMSDQNVALAYRIPLQVFGIGGTPFASTEALMSSWRAMGLGFALNHIEEAFGNLFRLKGFPDEYLELNTNALLRSNFKEQIEALSKSVLSGIHSSDDARKEIDLPETPGGYGKMPRVQQQVVPLSYGAELKPPKSAPNKPSAAPPADAPNAQLALEYSSDDILRRINAHAAIH